MNKQTRGKFITIEGIEGVGKSSNIKFIADYIEKSGKSVTMTREPGGTPIAEAIRKILLSEYEEATLPETELLLLYAGRLQHVEHVIKPALFSGKWVICDRFVDATFAYQGAGRGIHHQKIVTLNSWVLGDFVPDCTIVLDAPVEVALGRIQKERNLDRFEKEQMSFFEKIRQEYLRLSHQDPKRYYIVDAAKPLQTVQHALKEIMHTFLASEN